MYKRYDIMKSVQVRSYSKKNTPKVEAAILEKSAKRGQAIIRTFRKRITYQHPELSEYEVNQILNILPEYNFDTYDEGMDYVPEIAKRLGIKLIRWVL